MLNEPQIERLLSKIRRFETTLEGLLFEKADSLSMQAYDTQEQLYRIPTNVPYRPIAHGDTWGGTEHTYCWMKGTYTVPAHLANTPLYLRPRVGGYEAMLWVDGQVKGTFATKIVVTGHGNHYCDMIAKSPKAGQTLDLAMEWYTGHYVKGMMPFEDNERLSYQFTYDTVDVCTKNQTISDFYFDLCTVMELIDTLEDSSFRKADLVAALLAMHKVVYYSPDNVSKEQFFAGLAAAAPLLKEALAVKNSASAPSVGLIGHSHMDTAWLWHIDETIKKCARTFSNELNLMEQYDEYKFMQSSAYHTEMIRLHYPELFERIKQRVAEQRYEPNGGVWVECDCNLPSGESMVRQFLWGQRYTQQHFGYTSNCFWLPDTFGYSASIPQILKGCGIDYFLTTKMAWNDTTPFPYDTFYWKGLDGSQVFTHLNCTHVWPSPKDLNPVVHDSKHKDGIRQKQVSKAKFVAYGFGDGGGGPQFEMIEMARRIQDTDGAPKTEHLFVGDFMQQLEATAKNPNTYQGELYLELHRGTLTNNHTIKRNNRLAEIALHNLEVLEVINAIAENRIATDTAYRTHQNTLLVNQFHDILPGTCIPRANHQSHAEMGALLAETKLLLQDSFHTDSSDHHAQGLQKVTVFNPISSTREDVIYIPTETANSVLGYPSQIVTNLDGVRLIAVAGVQLTGYSAITLTLSPEVPLVAQRNLITLADNLIETPFATIALDEKQYIASYIDKANGRELCGEGFALNTFLSAEEVSAQWDCWDVDADFEMKLADHSILLASEVVSVGAVECRIRNRYQVTEKSTVTQDMIIYANSPLVKFETWMDWNDNHHFLKTAFDTSILADSARHEVQFGNVKRPTTRNNMAEQAKFEVSNLKYTDLSEPNYGIAILNDCKYAISVSGRQMRLSLHKGGCLPDFSGDHGKHYCEYAFLPHVGGFSAQSVIAPAYAFNSKAICKEGTATIPSLLSVADANIIIETLKPCEDQERAFIARLYEAEGTYTKTTLQLGFTPKEIQQTNLLEVLTAPLNATPDISLSFKPFEIKTIKIHY